MIHYHGLPLWSSADMVRCMAGHHAMVSHAHPRQIEVACEICHSVVLDNGAYTAWKAGKPMDFDGYLQWATEWLRHPAVDWCIVPDVIDGNEAANDALLNDWPLARAVSVPVFHMHESLDRLASLVEAYPRIALGSSGLYSRPGNTEWWTRMADMMRIICDADGRPLCKLHGLRMLDPVLFSHLPLASADSCNVARNVGIDQRWTGSYAPRQRWLRALILMQRIEQHGSAARFSFDSVGVEQNLELFG